MTTDHDTNKDDRGGLAPAGSGAQPAGSADTAGQALLSRFYRASRAVTNAFSAELGSRFDLELREFMVLSSIGHGCYYPTDIARRLHASKFAISRSVQRLTELGLIDREIDSDDSRRVRLTATPAGKLVKGEALAAMQGRLDAVLVGIGPERTALLAELFDLIIDRFAAPDEHHKARAQGDDGTVTA